MDPKVSFVVPCYKLAHLLPDCVNSILAQTYRDFEILIMDDCSPDNTPEVAASFNDPRVKHVRNDPNLKHLRNYNKGIGLSRGKYVWLISADDYLRSPQVLERYVKLLEENPNIGYAFCPGVKVRNGQEVGTLDYSTHGSEDRIFAGRQFLAKLIKENTIVAASGIVRKECYDRITVFPLDMPWGGDWYLWCVFALHYDVGYLAEPMVCYREHDLSMTNKLMNDGLEQCSTEDIAMPWLMKRKAEALGYTELARPCLQAAAREYARKLSTKRYRTATSLMSLEEFEKSLSDNSADETERRWVRARTFAAMADQFYWQQDTPQAKMFYGRALAEDFRMPGVWVKRFLLACGGIGSVIRRGRASLAKG